MYTHAGTILAPLVKRAIKRVMSTIASNKINSTTHHVRRSRRRSSEPCIVSRRAFRRTDRRTGESRPLPRHPRVHDSPGHLGRDVPSTAPALGVCGCCNHRPLEAAILLGQDLICPFSMVRVATRSHVRLASTKGKLTMSPLTVGSGSQLERQSHLQPRPDGP